MDRDGTRLHPLQQTRSHDQLPSWSPDGETIAFVADGGICTMRADGTHRHRISKKDSDFGVAWSPDGKQLAFTHGFLPGPGGDLQTSLYLMNADGSDVRTVIRHGIEAGTPAWSPNGDHLAVAGNDGIYIVNTDGGGLTRVVKEDFGFNPVAPAWSPTSRVISFVDDRGVELVDVARHTLLSTIPIDGGTFGDATSWTPSGDAVHLLDFHRQTQRRLRRSTRRPTATSHSHAVTQTGVARLVVAAGGSPGCSSRTAVTRWLASPPGRRGRRQNRAHPRLRAQA